MAEVVKVGFELDLFRGSVGNVGDVEGQDDQKMGSQKLGAYEKIQMEDTKVDNLR